LTDSANSIAPRRDPVFDATSDARGSKDGYSGHLSSGRVRAVWITRTHVAGFL